MNKPMDVRTTNLVSEEGECKFCGQYVENYLVGRFEALLKQHYEQHPTCPHRDYREFKRHIYNEISAIRDEVFWYEDAKGLENTALKALIDKCLDSILYAETAQ